MGSDGITQTNNTLTGQAEGSSKGITGEVNRKESDAQRPWRMEISRSSNCSNVKHADSCQVSTGLGEEWPLAGQFEGGEVQNADFGGGVEWWQGEEETPQAQREKTNQRDMGSIALSLISTNNSIFPWVKSKVMRGTPFAWSSRQGVFSTSQFVGYQKPGGQSRSEHGGGGVYGGPPKSNASNF